jgi:YVTN family beta-propeller protein
MAGTAYVSNQGDGTVSVIPPGHLKVSATIRVGRQPRPVSVAPTGTPNAGTVFVANQGDGTVSMIDPGSNRATTFRVGHGPTGVLVAPEGTPLPGTAYVVSTGTGHEATVSVIDPNATKAHATIPVQDESNGTQVHGTTFTLGAVALAPAGTSNAGTLYIPNHGGGSGNTVSVIAPGATTATSIKVGRGPLDALIAPAGTPNAGNIYVVNSGNGEGHTLSVIAPGATRATTVPVGSGAVGIVIAH